MADIITDNNSNAGVSGANDAIATIRAAQDKAFPIDIGLDKLLEALDDGRVVVLNEETATDAIRKAILVNSDEKKYRYELGKDCLIPCCKDAYKYILGLTRAEAVAALKGEAHERD